MTTARSVGKGTGAFTSLSSVNSVRKSSRLWGTAAALLGLATLAGCATRATLLQVRQDQRETRALLADQLVAIEGLRRGLEVIRERGESRRGRGPPPQARRAHLRFAD